MGEQAAFQRAILIVNIHARQGQRQATRARQLLQAAGVPLHASYALRHAARLPQLVRAAVAEGCDLIVLGGGDGSISSAVAALARQPTVLGLLPLGTANDFARTLGIPTDLEEACATVARGKVVDVDVGLAGDTYFVNVISLGLGGAVIQSVSPELKRLARRLAYPVATARALLRYRPFAATLTFPGGEYPPATFPRLLQIGVGNGRFYGGGMVVAPQAGIDDGALDVYAIELRRWRDLLGVALSFRAGQHIQEESVHYYRTARVGITTRPPLPINVDGELVDQTPELFTLERDALRVLVPRDTTTAD